MRGSYLLPLLVAGLAHGVTDAAKLRVNGWYPCFEATFVNRTEFGDAPFECAEVEVPLCHEGVCKSDKTIDLFVKRVKANATTPNKAVWMLQGGPGLSSVALETPMLRLSEQLNGTASIYTVDHRGTGRSFFLKCDAAQAFSLGSPGAAELSLTEIPNCVRDVLFQIDNHTEAFSVTSAAKDVVMLSSELVGDNVDTYVWGASYGTYWTQRIMHLAPKQVKGYIFDGAIEEKVASFERMSSSRIEPEKTLAKYCQEDKHCLAKYGTGVDDKTDLHAVWLKTMKTLEAVKPGENKCADLFLQGNETIPVSLRAVFYLMIDDMSLRVFVPAIMQMLGRCNDEDAKSLKAFTDWFSTVAGKNMGTPQPLNEVEAISSLLMYVIKASEMWSKPSTAYEDEAKKVNDGVLTMPVFQEYAAFCLIRGDLKDPSCGALSDPSVVASSPTDLSKIVPVPFVYEPDQYYHKTAKIPEFASAMVMNGQLDFHTVPSWGEAQYEDMEGNKMIVDFKYGPHCSGIMGSTAEDKTMCSYRIVASFVEAGGDLSKVNTECLADVPAISFDIDEVFKKLTGVDIGGGNSTTEATGSKNGNDNSTVGIVGKKFKKLGNRLRSIHRVHK